MNQNNNNNANQITSIGHASENDDVKSLKSLDIESVVRLNKRSSLKDFLY